MEQIDVLQYEKDLKRKRLTRMLKSKSGLVATIAGAAQIPSIIWSDFEALKVLNGFVIGVELAQLVSLWKREKISEEKMIADMLKGTTSYKEIQQLYSTYIESIAKLIKDVGLSSSKEVVLYLHALMELGYFSVGINHQYKLYEHEYDYLPEICGAKVSTGTSVCRHMSSFITDVMNEMGYTAANISCSVEKEDPVKAIKKRKINIDHAVVGIVDNGEHYLFDSTSGGFVSLPVDFDFTEIESILVGQYVIPDIKRYLVVNPHLGLLNLKDQGQFKLVQTTPFMKISVEEVKYLKEKIERVVMGNMYNQLIFYQSHKELIGNLARLYKEVSPYGDEPINKFLVRK